MLGETEDQFSLTRAAHRQEQDASTRARSAHRAAGWLLAVAVLAAGTLRAGADPGDVDTGFNPDASSSVHSLAVQADGKILVGGVFTNLAGQTRSCLARLNADGSLDAGFDPGAGGVPPFGPFPSVYSLAVQTDGKILVGGAFTNLAGQPRNCIARLNADGSLDTGFNPGASGFVYYVYSLAVQADGKILVGGFFSILGGQPRRNIARLNADGTLDTSFDPDANSQVNSLAVQADGKILVGGTFIMLRGGLRNYIARLNAGGTLDTSFNPGANSRVYSLAVQADGKILVGGNFTSLGGQPRNYIARLNADGSLDTGFDPDANDRVYTLAVQADGKILLGGYFTNLVGQTRNRIGRLNADGSLDTGFNPGADNHVYSLAVQADGKILVGGWFGTLGGQPRNYIARLLNEPATQSLTLADATQVRWVRGGSAPEIELVTLELSADGTNWTVLGNGTRITGGWEFTGLSLPASGLVRARGRAAGGEYNGSSGLIEQVAAFPVHQPPSINVSDGSLGFSAGLFGFNLSGPSGQVVVVEGSAHLQPGSWSPLWTNTLGSGPLYFSDPESATNIRRLYRARLP